MAGPLLYNLSITSPAWTKPITLTDYAVQPNTQVALPFYSPTIPVVGGTTVCGTADENNSVSLTAPAGTTFVAVDFASYGTPTGTCGNFAIGPCHVINTLTIVQRALLGKTGTVNIGAYNSTFGDPCGGTAKRLYIQARYA